MGYDAPTPLNGCLARSTRPTLLQSSTARYNTDENEDEDEDGEEEEDEAAK